MLSELSTPVTAVRPLHRIIQVNFAKLVKPACASMYAMTLRKKKKEDRKAGKWVGAP